MSSIFSTTFIFLMITFFISNLTNAQPQKGNFIDASIGYGLSAPGDETDIDITGKGFYAQGEFVFGISKWFGLRPYAGLILTSVDKDNIPQSRTEYKVTSKAFLLGGKTRISAPIPWFAPYFEVGLGLSLGSFTTRTPFTNVTDNGLLLHIPYSIGVALGPKHTFEIEFSYYYHPSVDQYSGAAALGLSFPL